MRVMVSDAVLRVEHESARITAAARQDTVWPYGVRVSFLYQP